MVTLFAAALILTGSPTFAAAPPPSVPSVTTILLEETPEHGVGLELRLDYGGPTYAATQFRLTGIIADEASKGEETKPSKEPDPNAPPPPTTKETSEKEAEIATTIRRAGYDPVVNDPEISPTDTDYLEGPPRGKYYPKRPDYRIQGELFDLYSPEPDTTPRGVAGGVDTKFGKQVDRVIVQVPELPDDRSADDYINDVIDEVKKKRKTPGTGTRENMKELWIVKPDGTIVKVFPGRIE